MLRALQGVSVLFLLSAFFAYVLAPLVDGLRRRMRVGRRQRPFSRTVIIASVYSLVAVVLSLVWIFSANRIRHAVHVSAPEAIDHLFSGRELAAADRFIRNVPAPAAVQRTATRSVHVVIDYLEREVRATFQDLLDASRHVRWLLVVPPVAFVLITGAPGFRRSAERLLPHGHLQWRAEEYLRDVNSALAGYVRAQLAAGVIVGAACAAGFWLLGLPHAGSMGVVAGALELMPAIGPIVTLLIASSQAREGVLGVVLFLGALRLVQDYVVYPRLIRHGMHLATPVVVLSIWCGAALAGATGVILAIPVAGFVSVSLRHWREYRAIERLVREHAQS